MLKKNWLGQVAHTHRTPSGRTRRAGFKGGSQATHTAMGHGPAAAKQGAATIGLRDCNA